MITNVAWDANPFEKRMVAASCSPGPTGTAPDRQMIQLEAGPRKNYSHDGSENDVKPVMPMIEPTGSGYKVSNCEWDECHNNRIDWRSGCLVSNRQGLVSPRIRVTIRFLG